MTADATTSPERIRPFDCGSQYAAWVGRNCSGCVKYDPETLANATCDIDVAISHTYFDDGKIDVAIAERMGYRDVMPPEFSWPCPERVPRAEDE